MIRCPFTPVCEAQRPSYEQIYDHILEAHMIRRSHSYGSIYSGNGSKNTLEINNDEVELHDKENVV